jgi:hypothetical protein
VTQEYLLEQELARRVGPFFLDNAATGATTSTVTLPTLQSTLPLGDQWTGLYARRRGFISNDPTLTPNPAYVAADAVRRIAGVNYVTGVVTVDRAWTSTPLLNETIELHYLDPLAQLHVAMLNGLQRCYFVDRAQVITTGAAAERDVTAVCPWITQTNQIYDVLWTYPGLIYVPRPVPFWREFTQNGHVWLAVWPDPWPNTLLVLARRPVGSQVNETTALQALVGTVWDATNSTPIQITTTAAHGLITGQWVLVQGSLGNTAANGAWSVTVVSPTSFTLGGSQGNGLHSTGGTVTLLSYRPWPATPGLDPSSDADDFPVTPDYAAAFGHVAAWQRFPDRLGAAAQIGLKPTLEQAAAEATRQARLNFQPIEKRTQFAQPFPSWSVARP